LGARTTRQRKKGCEKRQRFGIACDMKMSVNTNTSNRAGQCRQEQGGKEGGREGGRGKRKPALWQLGMANLTQLVAGEDATDEPLLGG